MAVVTIIGGHGKIALLAEPLLVERGHTVNAIIRNPDQSADIMMQGANPVVADIASLSAEEMATLFTGLGTEVLIWSAGAGGSSPERTYAIDLDAAQRSMDAAKTANISRYIMVSYLGAGVEHGIPQDNSFYAYAQAKAEADEYLRASGLDYTIVGPGVLTDEPAGGIRLDISLGSLPVGENMLDRATPRATVAQVLAEVVETPSTIGKALPFTAGDTPITQALQAAPDNNLLR